MRVLVLFAPSTPPLRCRSMSNWTHTFNQVGELPSPHAVAGPLSKMIGRRSGSAPLGFWESLFSPLSLSPRSLRSQLHADDERSYAAIRSKRKRLVGSYVKLEAPGTLTILTDCHQSLLLLTEYIGPISDLLNSNPHCEFSARQLLGPCLKFPSRNHPRQSSSR